MIYNQDGSLSYTLKRSKRAKHVRLKITRLRGLEIVVPERFKLAWLPEILKKREKWIHQAAKKLNLSLTPSDSPSLIPDTITLQAINEIYSVQTVASEEISNARIEATQIIRTKDGCLAVEVEDLILLPSGVSEEVHVALLRQWLVRSGKEYLGDMLEAESARVAIPFSTWQVRMQKTRWGSCSSRGGISLNARLMLLPEHLVRYILLHELAHRVHPNHSSAYWQYLVSLDENALEHDKAMLDAWHHVPLCFSM